LSWFISCFSQSYLFFKFLFFLFLFFILNCIQTLNQCCDFTLLVRSQKLRYFLTLSSSNLLLFAFTNFLRCFERKFGLKFFRYHKRIEHFWSSIDSLVFWVRIFLSLNSIFYSQLIFSLHQSLPKNYKIVYF